MRIGFVGTGTMGTPIAGCLIHAGHSLTVHDRRPEATAALCAQGAVRADSAFDAARESEVVFTSLPGPAGFEAAMLEPQTGILAGLQPGAVHIDLTTNAPKTIARIAEACRSRNVELVDAPVSGRPPAMTVMVGASDAAFAKHRALFDAIAANVFHVGPGGAGATAKLVTQYLGYTNFIASIEGMLIAAKAGIDLDVLARIVPVSAGQSRTFDNIPRGVFSGSFAAGGTLDIVAKDVELACQLARDVGAPATLGTLASDIYKRLRRAAGARKAFPWSPACSRRWQEPNCAPASAGRARDGARPSRARPAARLAIRAAAAHIQRACTDCEGQRHRDHQRDGFELPRVRLHLGCFIRLAAAWQRQ